MTEIVAILGIIILFAYAVYVVFLVARAITQKKHQEPEKETICDTCKNLIRKGGDIEPGKYKCRFVNGSFYESPEYCRNYEMRKGKKELQEVNADEKHCT